MGNPSSKLTYRADIEGLRAVAVLLVMADHFHTRVRGGFVGVDVFFVISGYLISTLILKEMASGTFSIGNFYERRIRRIVPALIVMLAASAGLAWRYLFPTEMVAFAHSLMGALFGVSNFVFWSWAGYFDGPNELKPLLHTWSLGVEEQFYLLFPIFLIAVHRLARRRLRVLIFAISAVTFGLSVLYVRRDPAAVFYCSPLRAWELLLGTVVSQRYLPEIRGAVARNAATLGGMLMILGAAWRYRSTTPFPGVAALAPCLGAALAIWGGETGSSAVGRVLSWRPLVFVGSISYSLYLWHWPVVVFQQIGGLAPWTEGGGRRVVMLFAVSVLLGYLSWRFVEAPFRMGWLRGERRALFLSSGAGAAVVLLAGVAILRSQGLPQRFGADALQAAQYLDAPVNYGVEHCFLDYPDKFSRYQQPSCLAQVPGRRSVLIMGDSHAAELRVGMAKVFPDTSVLQATVAACSMFLQPPANADEACRAMSSFLYGDFLLHHHIDAVVWCQRWGADDIPEVTRALEWMKEHQIPVYAVGPSMEFPVPFPRVLAMALRRHDPGSVAEKMMPGPRALDAEFSELAAKRWHVPYISFYENLCRAGCALYGAPGVPLLGDEDHLTVEGSELFVASMRDRGQLPL